MPQQDLSVVEVSMSRSNVRLLRSVIVSALVIGAPRA
jgi:hypothetical protein